ncbi:type 1 glutamine amidotransferase domain-containing protein [Gemmatimonas sp.]|uniref:type 1 glutamine amidotransferase domain-containing protein n=1 Tax=Gemmatimonas sp. TaxID=1962908 RepID=UPI0039834FC7
MAVLDINQHQYNLSNRKVAILATDGFEESELMSPLAALKAAGANISVISIEKSAVSIRGWTEGRWSENTVTVDGTVPDTKADSFDALMLPGGVMNPDMLRANSDAVAFVRDFISAGKPVAAICHAPWLIVEAGAASGRRMTSYPSIRTDVTNAGATWVDESVVTDQGLVTSRSPKDLDDFNAKMVEEFSEGAHARPHA